MAAKLRQEEVVTITVLSEKGQSNAEIARTLGVTEGAVRYHKRRKASGARDGRKNKTMRASSVRRGIEQWMEEEAFRSGSTRPGNVRRLFEWLVEEQGYGGSYRSVLRYVRRQWPRPKLRPLRRVETPPGAQAQVDWGEFVLDIGDGPEKLYAFVMVLSHSRYVAVVWCRRMDQLAWHHAHNEAFRRVGGIPAVIRIDNLKTGVVVGAGPWGRINQSYRSYARSVGFHVDACLPRSPEDKGKVERRVGHLRQIDPEGRRFDSLADLQAWTDQRLERSAARRTCPATGQSVLASWESEKERLGALPILPEVFDVVATRAVQKDCTVAFEGRVYSVPFVYVERSVEVRGCERVVQILCDGKVVCEHPRHSRARIVLDPSHYEGPGDDRVDAPVPLGKMGRRLVELACAPVEHRPLDLYAALAEVAR